MKQSKGMTEQQYIDFMELLVSRMSQVPEEKQSIEVLEFYLQELFECAVKLVGESTATEIFEGMLKKR